MKQYADKKLFLALENWQEVCPNPEERIKRHIFYLHCGLEDLPYRLKEAGVTFAIMGVGGPVEPEEYKALIDGYRGPLFQHLVDMRIIKD